MGEDPMESFSTQEPSVCGGAQIQRVLNDGA